MALLEKEAGKEANDFAGRNLKLVYHLLQRVPVFFPQSFLAKSLRVVFLMQGTHEQKKEYVGLNLALLTISQVGCLGEQLVKQVD